MVQRYNGSTVTVWVNGSELRAMEDNDCGLFYTPDSSQVYIASNPNFAYDRCVATTSDLLSAMGYDDSDGLSEDDVAELEIAL